MEDLRQLERELSTRPAPSAERVRELTVERDLLQDMLRGYACAWPPVRPLPYKALYEILYEAVCDALEGEKKDTPFNILEVAVKRVHGLSDTPPSNVSEAIGGKP